MCLSAVTATKDFLAPDFLNNCGRALPAPIPANGRTRASHRASRRSSRTSSHPPATADGISHRQRPTSVRSPHNIVRRRSAPSPRPSSASARNVLASRQTMPIWNRMTSMLHQPRARTVGPVLSGHWCCVSEKPSPFWSPNPVTASSRHEMDGTADSASGRTSPNFHIEAQGRSLVRCDRQGHSPSPRAASARARRTRR